MTSVILMVGPLPITEFIGSILGPLFVTRFRTFSNGYDRGLLIGGITLLKLRPLTIWYAYTVMVEGGTFHPREEGEPMLCEVASCMPLYFGMFVQYLPSLILAISMILTARQSPGDTPWWKRTFFVLAPYIGSILLLWPIWET